MKSEIRDPKSAPRLMANLCHRVANFCHKVARSCHSMASACHKPKPSHAALATASGLLASALLCGCGGSKTANGTTSPEASGGKPVVLASFYPLQFFAERIAGDLADISCPLHIAALQAADLILLNGAGFEKWPDTTVLPDESVVRTADAITEPLMKYEDAVVHSHGPGDVHTHEGTDGHTWMDPMMALVQAQQVHDALAKRLPAEHKTTLEKNFAALSGELRQLDAAFKEIKPPGVIFAEHPAYQYPARRYGWTVEHVDVENPPSKKTGLLLWEGEPSKKVPGFSNLVFSPCESAPESGDYLSVMRDNLSRLKDAL